MIDTRFPRIPSVSSILARAFLACSLLATTVGSAAGAQQSSDQQRCINEINKRASKLVREQGKLNERCLKSAGRADIEDLGIPPQFQTAQACLTNDVRGKIARRAEQLTDGDTSKCLTAPEQFPGFAYVGATSAAGFGQNAELALMADIFGPDLDLAVVLDSVDSDGARCQLEVVKRSQRIVDDLWKLAFKQAKLALDGKKRHFGPGPTAPLLNELELRDELTVYLLDDPKGKVAKAALKLTEKVAVTCAAATTSIASMFPGICSGAADLTELTDCVAGRAGGKFFEGLAGVDDLPIDCDVSDDYAFNGSCLSDDLKRHVLNRIGSGPDAWSLARIDALGVEGYILEQLSPLSIDDSALETLLLQYPSLPMSFNELRTNYPSGGDPGRGDVLRELQRSKMTRAVSSRRQLEQTLFDFWFNHFNVDGKSSGRTKYDISPYDRIAIRPYVLATFFDLVLNNARSPAMGDYLDNRRSKVDEINENYARELMELHAIGVDGGFDENDVVEVARCLTGWREDYDNAVDGFEFRASWHDELSKNLFGGALLIPENGGEQDGIDVLGYLSSQPATADFITRKLIKRFVNEKPSEALVAAASTTFLSSGGDIAAVMGTILLSDEFLYDLANRGNKVKRPHVLLASVARALGADDTQIDWNDLRKNTDAMGESLYEAPPPIGYPDSSGFWTSPGTLITRFNEIERRARARDGFSFTYPIASGTNDEIVDALIGWLFPGAVSSDTRASAVAMLDILDLNIAITDEEKIEQAAAFLMSGPEFLQH